MALICGLLGFIVVVQVRSQAQVDLSLANQDDTSIALLINDLNRANNELLQQTTALAQRQATLKQAVASGGGDSQAIDKELTLLKEISGEVPVHGPGVEVRIGGAVMAFELQDALNNLRNAGAEAFALNGTRIVSDTPIADHGQGLIVGGRPLSAPYVLDAIGDPDQLQSAADLSASSLQTRVQVVINKKPSLTINSVISPRAFIYAQGGS